MGAARLLPLLLAVVAMPTSAENSSLAPVEIRAGALNAAADIEPEDSTSPVRVIDRDAFENRITTLADTLSNQTGVQVRQSGGLGSLATVAIRGSSGKQVQVFLDGMLLNDPLYGSVDLSLFSLHDVGRIQIYPGNPPARIAQAGPGGTILLESLGADTHARTKINLGAGSFGTQRHGLFNSGSSGRFHYWFSANHQAADNDFRYPNRSAWFNPADGDQTRRRNADITQYDGSLNAGYQWDPARRASLLLQWTDKDQGIPTPQNWQSNNARLATRTQRAQLHYQDRSNFAGRLHRSHRLTVANIDESYRDLSGRVGTGSYDMRTETAHIGVANTLSWIQNLHLVSASIDTSYYDQTQTDDLRPEPPARRERWLVASALSHEWRNIDDTWHTQAVLRRTDLIDEARETLPDGTRHNSRERSDYSGWQLGIRHALFMPLDIYANVSRQVRIPTLLERFGQQGLFIGNRDLQPEEALNIEVGARWTGTYGHLEVTGFHRDLDPAIVTVFDARGVGRHVNIAAEFQGIEAEALYRVTEKWSLNGNLTLQDSQNTSTAVLSHTGKRVPGIYHRSAMIGSAWQLNPFQAGVSWHIDDGLYYDAPNRLPADTRQTVDASLSWLHAHRQRSKTRIDLLVRNIADKHYQEFNRFPGAGRAWFLTLQHTL
ncbi:MAG: TonB-dependent receptor [Alcanivorax sp.]|nr:TonB-dependent receptor [Alcanivorax sp.]